LKRKRRKGPSFQNKSKKGNNMTLHLPKLVRGPKAKTRAGFHENIERERALGKSPKRQAGTAYGEAYLGIDDLERKDRHKRDK
jgi:hypothetical protein